MDNRDSILLTIKKLSGMIGDYEAFDTDMMVFINSCFAILHQMGVGPEECFFITGDNETWTDFGGDDVFLINEVKKYIHLKVKKMFNPPSIGAVSNSLDKLIEESEYRLFVSGWT